MIKWNAQDLLDCLNKEINQDELHELWKALISYELGLEKINNKGLDKVLEKWYNDDTKTSILDTDLLSWYNDFTSTNIVENYFNDKN